MAILLNAAAISGMIPSVVTAAIGATAISYIRIKSSIIDAEEEYEKDHKAKKRRNHRKISNCRKTIKASQDMLDRAPATSEITEPTGSEAVEKTDHDTDGIKGSRLRGKTTASFTADKTAARTQPVYTEQTVSAETAKYETKPCRPVAKKKRPVPRYSGKNISKQTSVMPDKRYS